MKRFFCTICGRVKRVRKYPSDITSVKSSNVSERTGTCARHYDPIAENIIQRKQVTQNKSVQNRKRA